MLASQIVDASRSITTNIAEGYGRFPNSDTKNFFIISRGSTWESMKHLLMALDEGYISTNELEAGSNLCEHVFRLLNRYIAYLNKQNQNKKE